MIRNILILTLLISSAPAWSQGNPEKGEILYRKCISCHGKQGEGKKAQKAPRLAGQFDWYLVKQLEAMQSGERINKQMFPFIKGLSKSDFQDIAAYLQGISLE